MKELAAHRYHANIIVEEEFFTEGKGVGGFTQLKRSLIS